MLPLHKFKELSILQETGELYGDDSYQEVVIVCKINFTYNLNAYKCLCNQTVLFIESIEQTSKPMCCPATLNNANSSKLSLC